MHAAVVQKHQHVVVRGGDEKLLDEVAFLGLRADDSLPAAALLAIGRQRHALDVALVGKRHDDVLVGDEVLDVEVAHVADDLGAALLGVLLHHLMDVLADHVHQELLIPENRLVPADFLAKGVIVLGELADLQAGEPLELHGQDVVGLDVREVHRLLQRGS